MFRRSAAKKQQ